MKYINHLKIPLIFLIIISIGIPLVDAQGQQTLGGVDGFLPGQNIELPNTCANCTYINITFITRNGSKLDIQQPMTKDGVSYNYTLLGGNTTILGEYIVNWVADPDGTVTTGNFNFFVRKGGILLTTGEAVLYVLLMVVNFLAFFFFLYYAVKIPYSNDRTEDGTLTRLIPQKYLKLLSIWLSYGTMLWFMNILTGIINIFTYLNTTSRMMTFLYILLQIIGLGGTMLILALFTIEFWKDLLVPLFKLLLEKWANKKQVI